MQYNCRGVARLTIDDDLFHEEHFQHQGCSWRNHATYTCLTTISIWKPPTPHIMDVLLRNAKMALHCQLFSPHQHTVNVICGQLEAFACGDGLAVDDVIDT